MGDVSLNVGSQAIGGSKNIDYLNKINYNGKRYRKHIIKRTYVYW